MTDHSKLPWKVFYAKIGEAAILGVGEEDGAGVIDARGSFWGGHNEAKANAEFTVKAVNSYHSNLKRIAKLEEALRELIEADDDYNIANGLDFDWGPLVKAKQALEEKIND